MLISYDWYRSRKDADYELAEVIGDLCAYIYQRKRNKTRGLFRSDIF